MATPSGNPLEILKKVSIPSSGNLIMIIALCVLGGIGWLLISEKEEYLVQRNFRLLKLWSEDISSKIEGYQQVFRFSAEGILDELHSKTDFQKIEKGQVNRRRFLRTYHVPDKDSPAKAKGDSANSGSSTNDSSGNPANRSTPPTSNRSYSNETNVTFFQKEGDKNNQPKSDDHLLYLNKVSPWSCAQKSRVSPDSDSPQKNRGEPPELSEKEKKHIHNLQLQLKGMCLAEGLTTIRLSIPEKHLTETEKIELSVNRDQNPPIIQLTYTLSMKSNHGGKPGHSTETIQIIGEITLQSFLSGLFNDPIKETIFDEVLLFDSASGGQQNDKKGSPILFDSGSQEFSWTNFQNIIEKSAPSESFLSSLLRKPQDLSEFRKQLSEQNSPNQFLMNLPGKTNNVFTLPVIVSGNENTAWRLVAMIDHHAFQNSYLAISSSLVLGVMFLILGLLLSIPFLHLKTMGAKDPLRRSHVLTITLAAFLGTGAFTFLVLDLAIYDEGKFTLQKSMETSAKNIKERVHGELVSILSTLTQFDQSVYLKTDRKKIDSIKKTNTSGGKESILARNLPIGERPVLLEVLNEPENPQTFPNRQCNALPIVERQHCYPDFLNAFWMDQDGSLRINWAETMTQGVSTNVSLQGRDYVKNVLDAPDRLWQIPHQSVQDESKTQDFRFFLEPIISWTTGENTVVASMASQTDQQQPNGWVAAMEFKFVSLMDQVVIPPGIGFAIIENDTHRVLFHSKEGRNLREDFLIETDQNQQLRDLFTARTDGHVNGSYWGKARSFYTLPLEPLPWALVVYRDREIFQSVNLFGLAIAGGVYGLWSLIVYLIVWLLLRRNSKHRKAICLWPNAADHPQYVHLIKGNCCVFIVGLISLLLLSGQPGWQLATALLFIPIVSLIVAGMLIKIFPSTGKTSASSPSLRNSYSYLAVSYLLIFAVIPAFGSFSSVFHKEMTLLTQFQILETYKSFINSGKPTIQFREGELLDPRSLIAKLGKHDDPKSEYIHSHLSKNTKDLLSNYKDKEQSNSLIKPLKVALTKDLNSILSKNSLGTTPPFKQVMGDRIRSLESIKEEGNKPISNRLLLEKTFPDEIHLLPQTFQTITLQPGCNTQNSDEKEYYGFYPDFFLQTQWSHCVKEGPDEQQNSIFDQFFSLVSQPFLPLVKKVPLWGFIEKPWLGDGGSLDDTNPTPSIQKPIRWDKKDENFTVLMTDSQIQVGSSLPLQPWFLGYNLDFGSITFGKTIKYFLITGLFLFWIITIPKFIATRTVFLNYPTPFKVPQDLLFDQSNNGSSWPNQLILGFPGQGKTPEACAHYEKILKEYNEKKNAPKGKKETQEPSGKQQKTLPPYPLYFDLKTILPDQWQIKLSEEISSHDFPDDQEIYVTVDHLERQWKDPTVNLKKLELMEWLLNRSNHTKDAPSSPPAHDPSESSQDLGIPGVSTKVFTEKSSQEKS